MQDMNADNNGITYALMHIIAGVILIGGVWITYGVLIDEFVVLSTHLSDSSDIYGVQFENSINDLDDMWKLLLWVFLFASFMYGIITAIRKEGRRTNA